MVHDDVVQAVQAARYAKQRGEQVGRNAVQQLIACTQLRPRLQKNTWNKRTGNLGLHVLGARRTRLEEAPVLRDMQERHQEAREEKRVQRKKVGCAEPVRGRQQEQCRSSRRGGGNQIEKQVCYRCIPRVVEEAGE